LVVIAVKQQQAAAVLPQVARLATPNTVVVSIMAGRTLAGLEAALPPSTPLVRAMPNLPAAVAQGITVAVANRALTQPQRQAVAMFLSAIGRLEWVGDEGLLDAVTAVSGSGPAYVFLLTEALARAGVAAGLPAELAQVLARATVVGSGFLLQSQSLPPETLRENVTSPGGTTAAALDVLMARDGLFPLLHRAVLAAARRSRELAD
jgi:pyrroline-5-carboxylate reductase